MEYISIFTFISIFGFLILLLIFFLASSIRIVQEEKRLSVYRLGRYLGEKGPGLVLLIPIVDRGIVKEVGGGNSVPGHEIAGLVGETRTTVFTDGKVFLAGREWDAVSQSPIAASQSVRVVRMILEVEKD
jgi:membrane-bound ClpP family serine protease